jgi:riboflavin kinase/FMN adenylyltransferase
MKLIYRNLPSKRTGSYILTIGVFDGVHLGHRYLLKKLKAEAARKNKPSLVITFDFPPAKIISHNKDFSGYLTDYRQKVSLIEPLGIDYFWVLKVTPKLLRLSANDFLSFVNKYFKIDSIIVGSDFRFGIKAEAGTKELERLSRDYGFSLKIIDKKKFGKDLVSSSFLRGLIKSADLKNTKKFLGRVYSIKGKVIKGKGI